MSIFIILYCLVLTFSWNMEHLYQDFSFLWIPLISVIVILLLKWFTKLKPTLSRKERRYFSDVQNHIETVLKPRKQQLYRLYLEQSVGDHDL
ncbi:Uncharacterized protein GBIM_00135 [Gryllus bimaculatus]|nr:Uncharacterized protein GBIM_00135 [Gryllus bimaculatus]